LQLTGASILFAAFLWWFSTGVIFFLNLRSVHTFRWSMLAGSIVAAGSLYGLWASAQTQSVAAGFAAFTCGLLVWGWHTMSFYMGIVTGPRREPCPDDSQGLQRFVHATATSLYHELAITATAALIVVLTWQQPNLFGLWTFILLWAMHISAKLNVFLGVRNLNVEFIPKRLSYLSSYFRHQPMNLLFPISVTAGTVVTVMLIQQALAAEPGTLAAVGYTLLATLSALAVIEHWFMVLPIRSETLWRWSLKASSNDRKPTLQEKGRRILRASADDGKTGAVRASGPQGIKPGNVNS
jgi:putative photosynthetic complex assembly protein 2